MLISMKQHGFTVVELVIVITLMGILMGLGTFSIIDSQSHARDTERKSDIEIIAMNLENLYQSGNYDDNDNIFKKGKYPSTADMALSGDKADNAKKLLRDVDIKSLYSPGNSGTLSLKVANDTNGPTNTSIAKDEYLYMPIKSDGNLCGAAGADCRSFKLYAWLENEINVDGVGTYLYTVESKNQ